MYAKRGFKKHQRKKITPKRNSLGCKVSVSIFFAGIEVSNFFFLPRKINTQLI